MTYPLMNLYNRAPIAVDRGEGVWLIDTDGRRYIDCVAGIATDARNGLFVFSMPQQMIRIFLASATIASLRRPRPPRLTFSTHAFAQS